ncbi:AAA family ATPase [Thiothrix fructosivorans]|uniref:ATP-binding protein n=1 Tax=Thiothrix fructosivorans TaxID=111770 RepID=A0A8B0SIL4_9GAMM|nr:AAA family ATPase [Thiothrix fructosivorans]MBO0613923.1 ATP-binding protein [Thiothrix fructosivorans]QTX10290.1 ATP-binding protein [Thiothrix fructosivorans]
MTEHFIQYIDIERYKCFSDFSAHGFQRVNLIAGKNNVGKTALMEAIFINVCSSTISDLFDSLLFFYKQRKATDYAYKTLNKKDATDTILKQASSLKSKTNIQAIEFKLNDSEISRKYEININNSNNSIAEENMDIFSIANKAIIKDVCWIGSSRDSQEGIIDSFTSIQKKDREDDLNHLINSFDNEIEKIKVIGNSIQCRVTASDGSFSYRGIGEYGDGLRLYVSVIADMFTAENHYIFIDEIDNGVHYTLLDKLWDIILKLSKELNVQVFATTHSRECIESYCRIVEKHKERNISFITLVKNKEKQIKAIIRDYDTFTDSIHDSREVRGW